MNITVVMVARDEEYFIPISVGNACRLADRVFVLDTGSVDGTVAELGKLQQAYPGKLVFETKHFGGRYSFDTADSPNCRRNAPTVADGAYREMEARNYALERAEALFDPDWIIRMDADESFAPLLFDTIRNGVSKVSVGFSTELPTRYDPVLLNRTPEHMTVWGPYRLHDPHVFCWDRRKSKVRWTHPTGSHVQLTGPGFGGLASAHIIDVPVHFHYHRAFGPKSIYTFLYWEMLQTCKASGAAVQHPYGDHNMFAPGLGITRQNMYTLAPYAAAIPERFDAAGRFKVPRSVSEEFRKHSIENPTAIEESILDAWRAFLVYE